MELPRSCAVIGRGVKSQLREEDGEAKAEANLVVLEALEEVLESLDERVRSENVDDTLFERIYQQAVSYEAVEHDSRGSRSLPNPRSSPPSL